MGNVPMRKSSGYMFVRSQKSVARNQKEEFGSLILSVIPYLVHITAKHFAYFFKLTL